MALRLLGPILGIITIILLGIGVAQTGILGSDAGTAPSDSPHQVADMANGGDPGAIDPNAPDAGAFAPSPDQNLFDPGQDSGNGQGSSKPTTTTSSSTPTTRVDSGPATTTTLSATTTTKSSTTTTSTQSITTTTAPKPTDGVAIYPGDSIQAAVNANPPGTTFIIKAGTHHGQQVDAKAGDTFIGESGAILSGDNTTEYAFWGWKADGVTIAGLIIENYKNVGGQGVIRGTSQNWIVKDNEVRYNGGIGISSAGDGWKILNNHIHHNAQLGIRGTGANLLIQGNEIAYNNYQHKYDPGIMAGGTKWYKTTNLVVRDNYAHDNAGPGLKTDADNINVLYENNRVENNEGPGIFHEISYDAVIRNNTVVGNGTSASGGIDGAGILISNSPNVEVYGNTVRNNADGIAAKDASRGSGAYGPYDVKNLWVHDNKIIMTMGQTGITDIGNSTGGRVFTQWNNRFDYNNYVIPAGSKSFRWGGKGPIGVDEWVASGNGAHSSYQES